MLRHLAGRARVVGRELAALLGLAVAAAACGEDDGRRLERLVAAARAPAVLSGLERLQRRPGKSLGGRRSTASRSAVVIAWPVRSPTCSSRFARRATAAGEPVARRFAPRVNSTPSSSSQWIAPCASPVRISTSRRSAVSCDERQTSSAWSSGESSSPNEAWMPALRLSRVAGLERPLGRERDPRAGAPGREGGGKAQRRRCRPRERRMRSWRARPKVYLELILGIRRRNR